MNKATLSTRKMDAMGRLVVPIRIREKLGIMYEDEFDVLYNEEDKSVTFKLIERKDINESY